MKRRIIFILVAMLALVLFAPMPETAAASPFTPRTTAPDASNRYYLHTSRGGLNECILGNGSAASVLPNCVGYAWGRAYELLGSRPTLSKGNASTFWGYNDGYLRGQEPKLGAIICWGTNGGNHVAVVEHIEGDTVYYSDSSWSNPTVYFRYLSKTKAQIANDRRFQGYIYIGDWSSTPPPPSPPTVGADNLGEDFYATLSLVNYPDSYVSLDSNLTAGNDNKHIFRFMRNENGTYAIRNKHNNQLLDVFDYSGTAGAAVQFNGLDITNPALQWRIQNVGPGYVLAPEYVPSLVLDLNPPFLRLWEPNGEGIGPSIGWNQLFRITRVTTLAVIQNAENAVKIDADARHLTGLTANASSSAAPTMTVSALKNQFPLPYDATTDYYNYKVALYEYNGIIEADHNAPVGTGMVLRLLQNGTVVDGQELTIIVAGDVQGDGAIDIADIVQVAQALRGNKTLSLAAQAAANVVPVTLGIDIADLVKLVQMIRSAGN